MGRFFARAATGTAIAVVYIVIIGVVYNTVLRFCGSPRLQYVVDELLYLR